MLPFALGAAAVGFVVAPSYRKLVAHASEVETSCLAEGVAWNLSRAVDRLERLAAWREIRQLALRRPLDAAQAAALDARWLALSPEDEQVRALVQNSVARELAWWEETDPAILSVVETDARGRIIASDRKQPRYRVADEPWWRETYGEGAGRVTVSEVQQDPVSKAWGIRIGVPIFKDGAPSSRAVGVLTAFMDARRTFEDVRRAAVSESGRALLVDAVGRIVVSSTGEEPLRTALEHPGVQRLFSKPVGTYVASQDDSTDLFAWAQIPFGPHVGLTTAQTPTLFVVTRRSAGEAYGTLRTVNNGMLIIGLLTIAAAVLLGYWLADVWVVRQVRQLAEGMRELSRGNFDRASLIAEQLTHRDRGPAARDAEDPAIPH